MKCKAVIFDLFGTLVDSITVEGYEESLKRTALALGTPYDDFRRVWYETGFDRNTGVFPTTRAVMKNICERLNIQVSDERLDNAKDIRHKFVKREMTPRSDAGYVLEQLRNKGLKTALLSNCSPVTAELWDSIPISSLFDVTILSCSTGLRKPDPGIYKLVIDGLGVRAEDCMYVGDGDSNELSGALEMGMQPVMIRVDYEKESALYVYNRQEWDGPVIGSLTEVLSLVEEQ